IPEAASAVPKAGESLTFRYRVKLPAAPLTATAVITCDNAYTLYVNGQKVNSDDNWETVELLPIEKHLRSGENELIIVATNGGAGANPAGLFFEAILKFADKTKQTLATSDAWQWTAAAPNKQGRFVKDPGDWQPAAIIKDPSVWTARVGDTLASSLTQSGQVSSRMLRASLMKSDYLMRSLGRPNRDQIVSMRPSDLTTLEAIDLANGQVLADTLDRGAKQLLAKHADSPDELIQWLFVSALTRSPTASELAAARLLLGDKPDADAVEDLVWALLMLPEFQLIR
ncbi:MAG TPA: DUF1553 domain-containing protein, partial [Pirellulaceae bacterium]|nr:DUF1553 domain-containing protein [Pirellulaceae bacterium]